MGLRQARTVDIGAIGKACGYDWLFIDMEHGSFDVDTAAQVAVAALPIGITPIVRVPGKEHHHASRLLDSGAQGIVVPHIETREQAELVVSHCKYPPIGHRSVAGAQPQLAFQSVPIAEATKIVNEELLVVVMVETPRGIENAEAIASVAGLDVLMIGSNDLCAEMGIPGQFGNPAVEEAYRVVIAACRKHGLHPGMGGITDHTLMEKYISMGMRFILSGTDIAFLMMGARERAKFLQGLKL